MEKMIIQGAKSSPEVIFDCDQFLLEIKGDSYPEDAAEFFSPVFNMLEECLERLGDNRLVVNIDLTYFNSSSAKVLTDIFDMLDEASGNKAIEVNWFYDEEDEDNLEIGEELKEDLKHLPFHLVVKP